MDQNKALPIDILIHHDGITDIGFSKIVADMETWGEQNFLKGQDLQATHVEGMFSLKPGRIAKMNPPHSSIYDSSAAPWATMTGWALDLSSYGINVSPRLNPIAIIAWQAEINAHLGELYGWPDIWEASVAGLESRVPFVGAWLGKQLLKAPSLSPAKDCAVWLTARINSFVQSFYKIHDFNLFYGVSINDGRVTPADFPLSPYLRPIL